MLDFLLGLLPDFLKVWLGIKVDTAVSLGKAEQKSTDLQGEVNTLTAEAKAAANAPTAMSQLIEEQREGKV